MNANKVSRYVGLRPRCKETVEGEARPTQVVVIDSSTGKVKIYDLESEEREYDFIVNGKWPVDEKFRDVCEGEDLSWVLPHHIVKDDPKVAARKGRAVKPDQVPVAYDGLKEGDAVALCLGGLAADILGLAICRHGKKRGFYGFQLPSFRLKELRSEQSKDGDAELLATLLRDHPEHFRAISDLDQEVVEARIAANRRGDLLETRMVIAQQSHAAFLYKAFCTEEGGVSDLGLGKALIEAEKSDMVLAAIRAEEKVLERTCAKACAQLPIYTEVLEPQKGIGPLTSVVIIGTIGNILRFPSPGQFKSYCGLHVEASGRFPRQRRGERSAWNRKLRQVFFNIGESFNKFPDGFWGAQLRENKAMYQKRHPHPILREISGHKSVGVKAEPIYTGREFALVAGSYKLKGGVYHLTLAEGGTADVKGVQKYTPAHIHRMSVWRTVTEFAEWLYWRWTNMEGGFTPPPKVFPPEDGAQAKLDNATWLASGGGDKGKRAPESAGGTLALATLEESEPSDWSPDGGDSRVDADDVNASRERELQPA